MNSIPISVVVNFDESGEISPVRIKVKNIVYIVRKIKFVAEQGTLWDMGIIEYIYSVETDKQPMTIKYIPGRGLWELVN